MVEITLCTVHHSDECKSFETKYVGFQGTSFSSHSNHPPYNFGTKWYKMVQNGTNIINYRRSFAFCMIISAHSMALLRSLAFGRPKSSVLSSEQPRNGILIHALGIHIVYLWADSFGTHESDIQCLFTAVLFGCCFTIVCCETAAFRQASARLPLKNFAHTFGGTLSAAALLQCASSNLAFREIAGNSVQCFNLSLTCSGSPCHDSWVNIASRTG